MTAILATLRPGSDVAAARIDADRMAAALARYGTAPLLRQAETTASGAALVLAKRLMPLLPEDRYPDPLAALAQAMLPAPRWSLAVDVRLTDREALAVALGLAQQDVARCSDALLVALAFERWGEAAVPRIAGPLALIAHDRQTGRIVMTRDFSGERPLLYHADATGLWAASMPEGLLALPHIPRATDDRVYEDFLRSVDFKEIRTPYHGIERVMPGHTAIWNPATARVTQSSHWVPDLTPLRMPRQSDYEAALRTALDTAIAAALRGADNNVGAQLSMGFDSTAVVALAARRLATQRQRLTAFTGVPRPGTMAPMPAHYIPDEGDLAAQTAALHDNIDHVRVVASAGPLESLDRTLHRTTMPVPNICNLPWVTAIAQAAGQRGIGIMLTGSMGNATISESGVDALHEMLCAGRLPTWLRLARGFVRNDWMRWRGALWHSFAPFLPDRLWRAVERRMGRATVATDHFSALRATTYTTRPGHPDLRPGAMTSVEGRLEALRHDPGFWLKDDLAHWGLDLRDPTADRALVELSLRIPVERLCWNGQPRAILRKVLAGLAPTVVLDCRQRGYQAADWIRALHAERAELRAEIARIDQFEPAARLVDVDRLARLVDTMPEPDSPDWRDPAMEADYRYAILRGVSAARHMRQVTRSNV